MDKERNGGFEKMARIGGWLISVCSNGSGSGIGQRLPRIDCEGGEADSGDNKYAEGGNCATGLQN